MAGQGAGGFQVATIKPSQAELTHPLIQMRGNTFATMGTTVVDLMKYAYSVHADQVVGGPDWIRTQRFDVVGDPELAVRPTSDQMKAMVGKLLQERFGLKMHTELRELRVYAIQTLSKPPLLQKTTRPEEPNGIPAVGYDPRGRLQASYATLEDIAAFLQRYALDRPVVNQSAIPGRFDIDLKWTPDLAPDSHGEYPGLFTAFQQQLGLRLKPTLAKVNVMVVEEATKPESA